MGDAIRARIERDGPITFDVFMELALYGPNGFYETPPIGAAGDFVTSPHVHPGFGRFVARAVRALGDGATPERIAEVGAGDGTLAAQILAELGDVRYAAVERSAGARDALRALPGVTLVDRLEAPVDVVLAHELLDNLPFRLIQDDAEVVIDVDDGRLVQGQRPLDDELRRLAPERADGQLAVPTGALAFVDEVARVLDRGYALVIDYGADDRGGPPHGYRQHTVVEDLLAAPGTTDITAGVDFGWIARQAASRALRAFPTMSQADVLRRLGFDAWLRGELDTQREQLAAGRGLDAVRTWSARSRATLLVDPAGLGRMRWLVLAAGGAPAPAWLQHDDEPTAD